MLVYIPQMPSKSSLKWSEWIYAEKQYSLVSRIRDLRLVMHNIRTFDETQKNSQTSNYTH